jgi:hypothetical protein
MSDRGLLFLTSFVIVIGSLATAVWLVVTDQALSFDGLFLLLTCLTIALGFGLYMGHLLRQAMKELEAPAKAEKKAPAAKPAARPPGKPAEPQEAS